MEVPLNVPHLLPDGANWPIFSTHFHKVMQATHQWGHFDGTTPHPVLKDARPMVEEEEEMEAWDHEDIVARYLLSQRLLDSTLLRLSACPTARARWEHLAAKYPIKESQWEQERKQEDKELTKCKGRRTQRRGKPHSCREEPN